MNKAPGVKEIGKIKIMMGTRLGLPEMPSVMLTNKLHLSVKLVLT
jgi:hypothetical protein